MSVYLIRLNDKDADNQAKYKCDPDGKKPSADFLPHLHSYNLHINHGAIIAYSYKRWEMPRVLFLFIPFY
ncbi:hypothetical protein GCM10010917_05450 [Paenibacillus physcomitrellae]|uniref:Uncharacterized protein n=1 Tax=Paenibacillus physcomitrellae TaxID=1619311 RepID=A0ABQ1FPY1_9BACL|nr:hypothetical protein GCM10010917_05450 [Paenibacillus physcomitrellae]